MKAQSQRMSNADEFVWKAAFYSVLSKQVKILHARLKVDERWEVNSRQIQPRMDCDKLNECLHQLLASCVTRKKNNGE